MNTVDTSPQSELKQIGTLVQSGQIALAIAKMTGVVSQRGDWPDGHLKLGQLHASVRDWHAAARCFRNAMTLRPDWPLALYRLGMALVNLPDLPAAEAALRRAIVLQPEWIDAHKALAAVLIELRRERDAEPHCRYLITMEPSAADAHYNLGVLLVRVERHAEAAPALVRAAALAPQSMAYRKAAARCLVLLAKGQMKAGDYKIAGHTLDRAVELHAELPEAYLLMGRICGYLSELPAAETAYRRALELRPEWSEAHHWLALVLRDLERIDAALGHAVAAARGEPSWSEAQFLAGILFMAAEQPDEALSWFWRAVVLDPQSARFLSGLSNCRFWNGCFRAAQAFAGTALEVGERQDARLILDRATIAANLIFPTGLVQPRLLAHPAHPGSGQHLLAFVRHANDLDHMAPVVYKWSQDDLHGVTLVIVNWRLPDEDFRLVFLSGLQRVEIIRYSEVLPDDGADAVGTSLDILLPRARKTTITMDHDATELAMQLCRAARRRGVPVVALPHGDGPLLNRLIYADALAPKWETPYEHFDRMIFTNRVALEMAGEEPLPPSIRTFLLGSTRYSSEWLEILSGILPKELKLPADNRLKVVMFLIGEHYAISWSEVRETTRLLLSLPGVHLVVSRHPRTFVSINVETGRPNDAVATQLGIDEKTRHPSSSVTFLDAGIPGAALVAWGDVFLSVTSSIAFEPVMRRKPLLEMSYMNANYALVAREIKSTDMRCRDDLLKWLKTFLSVPRDQLGDAFYDEAERRHFIEGYIELRGEPPLPRYVELLEAVGAIRN